MDATVALTGMLPAVMLIAAALTAVTSVFLLWLYRRAVLRSMGALAGVGTPPPTQKHGESQTDRPSPLQVASAASGLQLTSYAHSAYQRAAQSLRRAAWVYAAGGLAYAVILTTPWMFFVEGGFVFSRFLWLTACYAWPTALALGLLMAIDRGEWFAIAGAYFAALIAIGIYGLVRNPELTVGQLAFFWVFANGAETVLLLAFLNRRVRAVGPLVLAFMLAGVMGAFLFINLAGSSDGILYSIVSVGDAIGLGAITLFVLMHVIGFAAFAVLGRWLLGWIGRLYQTKRVSDQSLTLDALFLLFGVVQSITLVFEGWGWIFTGLAAFAAYKLATRFGFALLRGKQSLELRAPMLLLLRVFSLGQRSERLFDALSKRWLRAGSISMIAGPDLVTTSVEPHEFLDFVGGRLSRQFVQGEADLQRRLSELDTQPDPDGRFRVNEFFCHADTWQMTMKRLAAASEAVLMDLRSFSRANQGCLYELEQLLAGVSLDRVLFVVDDSTDRPFLEQTLKDLWERVPAGSPNRALASPNARLFEAWGQSVRMAKLLLTLLLAGRREVAAA